MSTPTAARPTVRKDSHWYTIEGEPRYEMMGKTTGKPRAVTLRDARDGNLVPSVTTILKVLHKEALVNWLIEQAVLACLTSPRKEGEADDAFVNRVLHVERVQDQESTIAKDKGTEIHNAMEDYFIGQGDQIPEDLKPWIMPAIEKLETYGSLVASEKILVGAGYAGKTDLILEAPDCFWIWDFKSSKNLPDPAKGGAWMEHRLQLSGYAKAYEDLLDDLAPTSKPIRTGNLYISTVETGKFVICEHEEWQTAYLEGFAPLVRHWQWANRYRPVLPGQEKVVEAPQPAPVPAKAPTAPAAPPPPGKTNVIGGKRVAWSNSVRVTPQ